MRQNGSLAYERSIAAAFLGFLNGNERGRTVTNKHRWRMGWDSNPREACAPAGFQDRCLKPLGHPSKVLFFRLFLRAVALDMSLCYPICYPLPVRPYFSTPQRRVDLGGAILLHRRGDMRVQIQRDADSRMAEAFLCDLRVHPGKQEL